MMASAYKGILARSNHDICAQALLKVRPLDQIGYLNDQNLLGRSRCKSIRRVKYQNKKCLDQNARHLRSPTVMAVVSEPIATAKKVQYTYK